MIKYLKIILIYLLKAICQNVEFVEKENIGDLILFKRLLQWAYQELRKI